jgi:hypothetical protein
MCVCCTITSTACVPRAYRDSTRGNVPCRRTRLEGRTGMYTRGRLIGSTAGQMEGSSALSRQQAGVGKVRLLVVSPWALAWRAVVVEVGRRGERSAMASRRIGRATTSLAYGGSLWGSCCCSAWPALAVACWTWPGRGSRWPGGSGARLTAQQGPCRTWNAAQRPDSGTFSKQEAEKVEAWALGRLTEG